MSMNLPFGIIIPKFDEADYIFERKIVDPSQIVELTEQLQRLYPGIWETYGSRKQVNTKDGNTYLVPYKITTYSHQQFIVQDVPASIEVLSHKNNGDPAIICCYENLAKDEPFILDDIRDFLSRFLKYLDYKKNNTDFIGSFLEYDKKPVYMPRGIGRSETAMGKGTLQPEFDKAKIESLKAEIENLSEKGRKELYSQLKIVGYEEGVTGVLEFADKEQKDQAKPKVTFIHPDKGEIITYFSKLEDWTREPTIDIFEEIKKDIGNLRKPEVWACVERWIATIRYKNIVPDEDYKIAKEHLRRLGEKILEVADSNIIPKEIAFVLSIDEVELGFLKIMWEKLREPDVKKLKKAQEKLDLMYSKFGGMKLDRENDTINLNWGVLLDLTPIFTETGYDRLDKLTGSSQDASLNTNRQFTPKNSLFYVKDRFFRCVEFMEFISQDRSSELGYREGDFWKMAWNSFRNAFVTWKAKEHTKQVKTQIKEKGKEQPEKATIKEYLHTAKKLLKGLSSEQYNKLKADSLTKYGAIQVVNKSLNNNKIVVKIYPATGKIEVMEGLDAMPYTPK